MPSLLYALLLCPFMLFLSPPEEKILWTLSRIQKHSYPQKSKKHSPRRANADRKRMVSVPLVILTPDDFNSPGADLGFPEDVLASGVGELKVLLASRFLLHPALTTMV